MLHDTFPNIRKLGKITYLLKGKNDRIYHPWAAKTLYLLQKTAVICHILAYERSILIYYNKDLYSKSNEHQYGQCHCARNKNKFIWMIKFIPSTRIMSGHLQQST